MKKYAKVINEETKACEVGLGTNSAFYQSIGMTEMDVEQAYNGQWYLKGYCPEKTCEDCKCEAVETLKQNRDAQLAIPFTYNGYEFQIDSNSTNEIDKWERCLDETTVPTTWLDVENVSRTFDTVADFTAFKNASIKESKKVWDVYNSKRNAITKASTKEVVEAIDLTIDVR